MSLYARLAWDGIRKNKRLYLPYILTCVGAVTMYYMMRELRDSPLLESMKGGGSSLLLQPLITRRELRDHIIGIVRFEAEKMKREHAEASRRNEDK